MAETIKIAGELESVATGGKVVDISNVKDKTKGNKSQAEINAEHETALAERYTKAETYNKSELNNMITTPNQQYVSVTATDQTTDVTDVLPATGAANTVYRVGNWDSSQFDASVYSEYAWNGSFYVHLSTKTKVGEVFDISAYHATGGTLATYSDLNDALNGANGGIPQSLQSGGMSVKFVQSSDNNYMQFRCIADSFTTDTTQWAIADEGVYVENPEFVSVKLDAEGRIIWAIRTDGSIYYGAGVPPQIINYINERIEELSLDEYEDIVAFLADLEKGDETLQDLLDKKVNKVNGKSLVDEDFANGIYYEENPEFFYVMTDAEGKISFGIKMNGEPFFGVGCPEQIKQYVEEKIAELSLDELIAGIQEQLATKVDKEEGKSLIDSDYASSQSTIDNPEYLQVTIDSEDKILEGIKLEGVKQINLPIDTPSATIEHVENPEFAYLIKDKNGRIPFAIKKSNGAVYIPLLENDDLKNIQLYIDEIKEGFSNYPLKVWLPIMKNLKRTRLNDSTGLPYNNEGTVTLLWMSDIHNEVEASRRFLEFAKKYGEYIDDTLLTGDYVTAQWEDNTDAMASLDQFDKILFSVGNHDLRKNNTDNNVPLPDAFARYFKNWDGVVYPEGAAENGYMYWYKDYSLAKVRLISLDNFNVTEHQVNWLVDVLEDARQNNLGVMIAQHVPVGEKTFFSQFNSLSDNIDRMDDENYLPIQKVQDFIDDGGTFICWLFGHTHTDHTGYFTNYPKQAFIVCGGALINEVWQDTFRVSGTPTIDSFNVLSIDNVAKFIRLVKVGATYDRNYRKRESIVINYGTNPCSVVE